jgi:hypothetical protein
MANLLVINSSATREASISRLMCEQWIKESKGTIKAGRQHDTGRKTARMAQGQQSPVSGVLLGELYLGVCKAAGC